jgi:hypothetical protein
MPDNTMKGVGLAAQERREKKKHAQAQPRKNLEFKLEKIKSFLFFI